MSMSESERDKDKKEYRWTNVVRSMMTKIAVKPLVITCTPTAEIDPMEPRIVEETEVELVISQAHTFEIKKVYLFECNGQKTAVALCPIHCHAMPINLSIR
jgi:hypothetical protein